MKMFKFFCIISIFGYNLNFIHTVENNITLENLKIDKGENVSNELLTSIEDVGKVIYDDYSINENTKPQSEVHDSLEDSVVFEDSEVPNRTSSVTGTLIAKLPEMLKHSQMGVNEPMQKNNLPKKESVIQKLSPRRVRQDVSKIQWDEIGIQNSSNFQEILDFYNPYRIREIWKTFALSEKLSKECNNEMNIFLTSLGTGTPWAIKMWDASGHYSGSYFWGNPYWMGSKTMCTEISNLHEELPFALGFFIARVNMNLHLRFTTKQRYQFIGMCLPYECSADDVKYMTEGSINSGKSAKNRHVASISIKTPHQYYNMFKDDTFWLLVISGVMALTLIVVGSTLDILISKGRNGISGEITKRYKYGDYTYAVNPPTLTDGGKTDDDSSSSSSRNNSSCMPTSSLDSRQLRTDIWYEVFLSFSIFRNTKQICDSSIGEDTIPIIHGLRSISMAWVILGHTCIVAFKYSDNMEYRKVAENEILYQTINNTAYTVDTFFFISGLLVSFLYFRTMAKVNVNKITKTTGLLSNFIEFIGLIAYRFFRLTVPYIFTLGMVEVTMKWFYYNSVFDPPADDHINCPNYWWRNLLYINTLFPVKDMCMLWSWYLADDTQFYIIGIILLITAVRHFRFATISVAVLLLASWFTTGYIAFQNNHMPSTDDPLALFDKIYDKPWTRFGPYLIGMIIGWILCRSDCKIPMKKSIVAIGWTICTFGMLFLIYGLHRKEISAVVAAGYSSLSHTLWAICLSWIVIACTTGHGGVANKLLSWRLLIPFSRITYCAYLVHPIVIRCVVMKRDSPMHLAEETVGILFFGQLVVSYGLAFILSLTFEAPIVSLLKIISPTKRNRV